MNLTFSELSGDPTMRDCCRSRNLLIRMMYSGVMSALGVRDGNWLEILCVEPSR